MVNLESEVRKNGAMEPIFLEGCSGRSKDWHSSLVPEKMKPLEFLKYKWSLTHDDLT